jgi:hypothetical protein
MHTVNSKLYGICRKNLNLSEHDSREFVQVIDETITNQHDMLQQNTQSLFHKDMQSIKDSIQSLKESVDVKFIATKEYIDAKFAGAKEYVDTKFDSYKDYSNTKFATKDDLSFLRTDLTKAIYMTSLGQLLAIVISVASLVVLILRK